MIHSSKPVRSGNVLVLVTLMMIFLVAMLAFSIDVGYICVTRQELQTTADAAAMAGASQLLDRNLLKGTSDKNTAVANARKEAQRFSELNRAGGIGPKLDANTSNNPSGDIVCGFLNDPSNLSEELSTTAAEYNSCRVRVRRTAQINGPLQLFFASIFGHPTQALSATATATYEGRIKGFRIKGSGVPTAKLLPFTLDVDTWNNCLAGIGPDEWNYNPKTRGYVRGSDGIKEVKLYPWKQITSGNFGTVDIGNPNNSTADIERQILYGPNQADFDYLGGSCELGPNGYLFLNGDTGISAGFKDALAAIRGQPRTIPIYKPPVTGNGNNSTFKIVAFAGVVVLDVQLTGPTKYVTIQPEFVIDKTAYTGTGGESYYVYRPLRLSR